MNLLCAGLRELHSGKTTLTIALIRYFKEMNMSVSGYKPRSGNNVWYHWSLIERMLREGRIYGKDAKLLLDESEEEIDIYALNPVHRLWGPQSNEISWGNLPNFLLDRITHEDKNYIAINKKISFPIDKNHFEKLLKNSEIIPIQSTSELNELNNLYEQANEWGYQYLSTKYDHIIYESYSDIGIPFLSIPELDYIFVIEPFVISIYPGDRYLKALEYASTISIEIKTSRIIELLRPIEKIKIPPYAGNVEDKLKDKMKPFLDALFDL